MPNERSPRSDKVVQLRRRARPLTRTYQPSAPYVVEREDQDDGSITYEVWDHRPESYRCVCSISDGCNEYGDTGNSYARHDADQVARALNFMVQCGKEKLPQVRGEDDE